MLKWTSKPSMHDSAESVTQSSLDSMNPECDGLCFEMADGSGSSKDDLPYSITHRNNDSASDDFVICRNKNSCRNDSFCKRTPGYPEPDLKWTPRSRKYGDTERRGVSNSRSLPSSPVEIKSKSKHDNGYSKTGILTRFKKIFTKSSRDRRSKSLPSSPKHERENVETMPEKQMREKTQSGKRSHTRLERLIESKRNRRKTLGHGKEPWVKTSPLKIDWKESVKSKISHPMALDRQEGNAVGESNVFAPVNHKRELQSGMKGKSKSSQLFQVYNHDKHVPRASSFRNNLAGDDQRTSQIETNTAYVPRNAWNKRYSDTFIEIKKSENQEGLAEIPPNWFRPYHNQDNVKKGVTYHSDMIYPNDVSDAQRMMHRKPGRKILPIIDPVLIQTTKESLKPCEERISLINNKGKLHSPRHTSSPHHDQSRLVNKENMTSKHTINNNNGHQLLQKQRIDELSIRTAGHDSWKSPLASGCDRTNWVADSPSSFYGDNNVINMGKIQRSCASSSSVKDMIRSLEEKIIQTSPSPTNVRPGKMISGQNSTFISPNSSDAHAYPHRIGNTYRTEENEGSMFNSFQEYHNEPMAKMNDQFHGENRRETQTVAVSHPLDNDRVKRTLHFMEDRTSKQCLPETTGCFSTWEQGAVTFTSQDKTSEYDINFTTSPTMSMKTPLDETDGKDSIEHSNSDVNSPSTFSKIALDAKEYCESFSSSFTSSLNIRLVQNEKFLSDKSSLSSCVGSVSGNSLHSSITFLQVPTESEHYHDFSKSLDGFSNFDSKSTDEDKSTRCQDDVGEEGQRINQEIQACINVTTSEYVNRLTHSFTESDHKHVRDGLVNNFQRVDEYTIEGERDKGPLGMDVDLDPDDFTTCVSHITSNGKDTLCLPYEHCGNEFQSSDRDGGVSEYITKRDADNQLINKPSTACIIIDSDKSIPNRMQDDEMDSDINTHIRGTQDVKQPTLVDNTLKYDPENNGQIMKTLENDSRKEPPNGELMSSVEENHGMIIFTMPNFSVSDNDKGRQVEAIETNYTPQKRVSFNLETTSMSTVSSDSNDLAQVEGNLSEQSSLPEEDGGKTIDVDSSFLEHETNNLMCHQSKIAEDSSKDGEMPVVPERALVERSVSLDKNTSPSSMGASDISWVLESYTSGFMCNETKDMPSIEQLPKRLTFPSVDIMESYPNEMIDGCRVCDIEEPSLVLNTYVEDSSAQVNVPWRNESDPNDEKQEFVTPPDEFEIKVTDTIVCEEQSYDTQIKSRKRDNAGKNKGLKPTKKFDTKELEKMTKDAGTEKTVERIEKDLSVFPDQKDSNYKIICDTESKKSEIIQTCVEGIAIEYQDIFKAIEKGSVSGLSHERLESGEKYLDRVHDYICVGSSPEEERVGYEYIDNDNPREYLEYECGNSNPSSQSRVNENHMEIGELGQKFPNRSNSPSSRDHQYYSPDDVADGQSDHTLISWPCHEIIDEYETEEKPVNKINKEKKLIGKKYVPQEGYSLTSSESAFKSKGTEARVKTGLSTKRKNKISRSLQVSGVQKRDAALFMSDLSIDNSGDCIDSEEEIHSSVNDDIAKAITASRRGSKEISRLERYQRRARRDLIARKKRKNRGDGNRLRKPRDCHNDYDDVYFDSDASYNIERKSNRKSKSEHNLFDQSLEFMNSSEFWDNGCDDKVPHTSVEERESNHREYIERIDLKNSRVEGRNAPPRRNNVHWTTSFLNHRPGQWLFLATFLFFQLLFHCIYVK